MGGGGVGRGGRKRQRESRGETYVNLSKMTADGRRAGDPADTPVVFLTPRLSHSLLQPSIHQHKSK